MNRLKDFASRYRVMKKLVIPIVLMILSVLIVQTILVKQHIDSRLMYIPIVSLIDSINQDVTRAIRLYESPIFSDDKDAFNTYLDHSVHLFEQLAHLTHKLPISNQVTHSEIKNTTESLGKVLHLIVDKLPKNQGKGEITPAEIGVLLDEFWLQANSLESSFNRLLMEDERLFQLNLMILILSNFLLFSLVIIRYINNSKANKSDRQLLAIKEQEMVVSQQQLNYVITGADLGYWDWDYLTGHHQVNDRWLSMLGDTQDDINNDLTDWSDRIHPEDKDRVIELIQGHIKSGTPYVTEFRMRHKSGHWVWIQGSGAVVEYDPLTKDPLRLCGTHQDISVRKSFEMELMHQAKNDHLTGLMNRVELEKAFKKEFARAIRHHSPLSVFMIDVDYFKLINDGYGHAMGDKALKAIAVTIKNGLREHDIIARYGGEEFVVVLPETSSEVAVILAERIRSSIQQLSIDVIDTITVSIGIDSLTETSDNFYQLLNNADQALYMAKNKGRNQVVFFSNESISKSVENDPESYIP